MIRISVTLPTKECDPNIGDSRDSYELVKNHQNKSTPTTPRATYSTTTNILIWVWKVWKVDNPVLDFFVSLPTPSVHKVCIFMISAFVILPDPYKYKEFRDRIPECKPWIYSISPNVWHSEFRMHKKKSSGSECNGKGSSGCVLRKTS